MRAVDEWWAHAACRGMDTTLFFPSERVDRGDTNAARILYREAREICFTCPVRTDCLNQALIDGDVDYGMFGGLTPDERRPPRARNHTAERVNRALNRSTNPAALALAEAMR